MFMEASTRVSDPPVGVLKAVSSCSSLRCVTWGSLGSSSPVSESSMSMMASTALVMASPRSFSAMHVYTPASSFLLSRIHSVPYSSSRGASCSSFLYQRRLGRGFPTATTRSRMSQPVPMAAFFSFRTKAGAARRAGPPSATPCSAVTLARFGGMPGLGGAAPALPIGRPGSPPAPLMPPRARARCMAHGSPVRSGSPAAPIPQPRAPLLFSGRWVPAKGRRR